MRWWDEFVGKKGTWKWALRQMKEGRVVSHEMMACGHRYQMVNGSIFENRFSTVDEVYTEEQIEKEAINWVWVSIDHCRRAPFWDNSWEIFDSLAVPKPKDMPSISPQEAENIQRKMMGDLP